MKKFLLLHYSYEVPTSPRAIRWRALVDYWMRKDICVDIICAKFGNMARIKHSSKRVKIYKTKNMGFFKMQKLMNSNQEFESKQDSPKEYLRKILKHFYDLTWKKIYWPDSACMWYFPALYKSALLLGKNDYDCLITVAPSFTAHLVGLTIKRFFYPEIKWLADYGDPFAFQEIMSFNNVRLYEKLNILVEAKVVHGADLISVTTDETRKLYLDKHKVPKEKIFTAPPLVSNQGNRTDCRLGWVNGIHFVFTGKFYKKIRNPEGMMKMLGKLLANFQEPAYLHIYGDIKNMIGLIGTYKERLGDRLIIHGEVPKSIADMAIYCADFLVNVSNISTVQLPSKVIEYMSTGNPIINFSDSCDDLSTKALHRYPLYITVQTDSNSENELQRLRQFISGSKGKKIPPEEVKEIIRPYSISSVGELYLKNIERILSNQ